MPSRLPPYVLNYKHEVSPELDLDWTRCPEDWPKELRLREVRNGLIKDTLLSGKPVLYRSSGGSLWPKVHNGDQCTFDPVTSEEQVQLHDIVFCQVKRAEGEPLRYFAHLVKNKEWDWEARKYCFTISNAKKGTEHRENGYCYIETIYGLLKEVVGWNGQVRLHQPGWIPLSFEGSCRVER